MCSVLDVCLYWHEGHDHFNLHTTDAMRSCIQIVQEPHLQDVHCALCNYVFWDTIYFLLLVQVFRNTTHCRVCLCVCMTTYPIRCRVATCGECGGISSRPPTFPRPVTAAGTRGRCVYGGRNTRTVCVRRPEHENGVCVRRPEHEDGVCTAAGPRGRCVYGGRGLCVHCTAVEWVYTFSAE